MDNGTANLLATLLVALVTTALPLVAAAAARNYRAWYERQPSQQQAIIDTCIRIAVFAAEQLGTTGQLPNKKVAALKAADEHLRDHGISLPLAAIDDRIEACVFTEFNRWRAVEEVAATGATAAGAPLPPVAPSVPLPVVPLPA